LRCLGTQQHAREAPDALHIAAVALVLGAKTLQPLRLGRALGLCSQHGVAQPRQCRDYVPQRANGGLHFQPVPGHQQAFAQAAGRFSPAAQLLQRAAARFQVA